MTFFLRATFGVVCLAAIAFVVAGCSGDQQPTAPVSGKVTFNGEAVTSGIISFSPIASETEGAKSAAGVVQSDGSYTLTTYADNDGAVIGKHRVLYSAAGGALTEEDTAAADASEDEHEEETEESPYIGLIPKVREVDVAAGDNQIDIELVSMSGG
jgi:hypothetical protein